MNLVQLIERGSISRIWLMVCDDEQNPPNGEFSKYFQVSIEVDDKDGVIQTVECTITYDPEWENLDDFLVPMGWSYERDKILECSVATGKLSKVGE